MKLDIVAYHNSITELMRNSVSNSFEKNYVRVNTDRSVFKIDASLIDFVEPFGHATPIPMAEHFVLGVCHARGRVLLALDMTLATGGYKSLSNSKLIAFKSRDVALVAQLSSEESMSNMNEVDFSPENLSGSPLLLSYLYH